jgi:hypothetical protein
VSRMDFENAARNRLDRAAVGLLESEFVMDGGRRKRVYRVAREPPVDGRSGGE